MTLTQVMEMAVHQLELLSQIIFVQVELLQVKILELLVLLGIVQIVERIPE